MSSALLEAIRSRSVTEVRELLVNPNELDGLQIFDGDGKAPVHHAAEASSGEVMTALLECDAGMDTKTKDGLGRSPLHLAVLAGNFDTARSLILAGAKLQASKDGNTPLHEVCRVMNGAKILKMIFEERAVDVNVKSGNKNTPLHEAARTGHLEVAELFLRASAFVDSTNNNGESPLHLAVIEKFIGIVRLLLSYAADPTLKDGAKRSPLTVALEAGDSGAFEMMANAMPEGSGLDPMLLLSAVQGGQLDAVKLLLSVPTTDATVTTKGEGLTALHLAADVPVAATSAKLTKLLVERAPALLQVVCKGTRATALHHAVVRGHVATIEVLLAAGADPNALDRGKHSPLHLAVLGDNANIGIATRLIAAGANVALMTPDRRSPLHAAVAAGNEALAEVLLAADGGNYSTAPATAAAAAAAAAGGGGAAAAGAGGAAGSEAAAPAPAPAPTPEADASERATLDVLDSDGYAPLHYVAMGRMAPLCITLLRRGAAPDTLTKGALRCNGMTALHICVTNPAGVSLTIAAALLAAGANPNVRRETGKTPLHDVCMLPLSAAPDHVFILTNVLQMLVEARGEPHLRDDMGSTCLHYAVSTEHTQAVSYLSSVGVSIRVVNKKKESPYSLAPRPLMAILDRSTLPHAGIRGWMSMFTRTVGKLWSWSRRFAVLGNSCLLLFASEKKFETAGTAPLFVIPLGDPATAITGPVAFDSGRRSADVVDLDDEAADDAAPEDGAAPADGAATPTPAATGTAGTAGAAAGPSAAAPTQAVSNTGATMCIEVRRRDTTLFFSADSTEVLAMWAAALRDRLAVSENTTAHLLAARGRDTDMQDHIASGADIHVRDVIGNTPLLRAAAWNRVDTARTLLLNGADPDAVNSFGVHAMHLAVANASIEFVELLLQFHSRGVSPPAWGAPLNDFAPSPAVAEAVNTTLRRPKVARPGTAPPNRMCSYATFIQKILTGDAFSVAHVGATNGLDFNWRDAYGRTPLHLAATNGYVECVKFLMMLGADAMVTDAWGLTPLHHALYWGHLTLADVLLAAVVEAEAALQSVGSLPAMLPYARTDASIMLLHRGGASMTGKLRKKGGGKSLFGRKSWRERHFVLRSNALTYYESLEAPKPLGTIPMPATVRFDAEQAKDKRWHFYIETPTRTFELAADEEREAKDWAAALDAVRSLHASRAEYEASRSKTAVGLETVFAGELASIEAAGRPRPPPQMRKSLDPAAAAAHAKAAAEAAAAAAALGPLPLFDLRSPLSLALDGTDFIAAQSAVTAHGSDVATIDVCSYHSTPLHLAASFGGGNAGRLIGLLLARGGSALATDLFGRTPLHIAARAGALDAVQALFAAGANLDAVDSAGNTALLTAVAWGHPMVVRALLDYGADRNIRNAASRGIGDLNWSDEVTAVAPALFDATAAAASAAALTAAGAGTAPAPFVLPSAALLASLSPPRSWRRPTQPGEGAIDVTALKARLAGIDAAFCKWAMSPELLEDHLIEQSIELLAPLRMPHAGLAVAAFYCGGNPTLRRLFLTDVLASLGAEWVRGIVAAAHPDFVYRQYALDRGGAAKLPAAVLATVVDAFNALVGQSAAAAGLWRGLALDFTRILETLLPATDQRRVGAWLNDIGATACGLRLAVDQVLFVIRAQRFLCVRFNRETLHRLLRAPSSLDTAAPLRPLDMSTAWLSLEPPNPSALPLTAEAPADDRSCATVTRVSIDQLDEDSLVFTAEQAVRRKLYRLFGQDYSPSSLDELKFTLDSVKSVLAMAPDSPSAMLLYGRIMFEIARRGKDHLRPPWQYRTLRVLDSLMRAGMGTEPGEQALLLYICGKHLWASQHATALLESFLSAAVFSVPRDAIARYKRAPQLAPPALHGLVESLPKIFEYFCRLLEQREQYAISELHYREAIRFSPAHFEHLVDRARMLRLLAMRPGFTMEVFEMLTSVFPNETDVWSEYGLFLMQIKRVEKAAPALRRAVTLSPSNEKALRLFKLLLGKFPAAKQAGDDALLNGTATEGAVALVGPGGRAGAKPGPAGPGGASSPGGGGGGGGGGAAGGGGGAGWAQQPQPQQAGPGVQQAQMGVMPVRPAGGGPMTPYAAAPVYQPMGQPMAQPMAQPMGQPMAQPMAQPMQMQPMQPMQMQYAPQGQYAQPYGGAQAPVYAQAQPVAQFAQTAAIEDVSAQPQQIQYS